MLDTEILRQLREHFSALDCDITLSVRNSNHPRQQELLDMLGDVASCAQRIQIRTSGEPIEELHFEILKNQQSTGIYFKAVPGGHEFTSLILAILNASGKGRLPDPALQNRVRNLRGPIFLRTFVSLECTNCPQVVQSLNQMALMHPEISHTILDGELYPEEIKRLNIQGVPAVFHGDQLIHVGKAEFGELLETLELRFGSRTPVQPDRDLNANPFDVLVLGGGPAGISAAIYSARKGLRTGLIAQRLGGQVNDTLDIQNLISVAHTQGPRLAQDLRAHLEKYSVEIFENRRVERVENQTGERGSLKTVCLQGGETLQTYALIIATGAKWRELGVPGEREYIGRGVAFCPHCDGPFFKGKRVAVIGGGNSGVEAAIDLAGICSHVTLLEYSDKLKADRILVNKLMSLPNVSIIYQARTVAITGDGKAVTNLSYEDRDNRKTHELPLDGVFVQIGLTPNSAPFKDLVETNRAGEILVDQHCRTSVPGIYAAGDVTTVPYKQIVIAMGEGAKAALSSFEDRMRSHQPS